jgi:hypothetical protein
VVTGRRIANGAAGRTRDDTGASRPGAATQSRGHGHSGRYQGCDSRLTGTSPQSLILTRKSLLPLVRILGPPSKLRGQMLTGQIMRRGHVGAFVRVAAPAKATGCSAPRASRSSRRPWPMPRRCPRSSAIGTRQPAGHAARRIREVPRLRYQCARPCTECPVRRMSTAVIRAPYGG